MAVTWERPTGVYPCVELRRTRYLLRPARASEAGATLPEQVLCQLVKTHDLVATVKLRWL